MFFPNVNVSSDNDFERPITVANPLISLVYFDLKQVGQCSVFLKPVCVHIWSFSDILVLNLKLIARRIHQIK